MDYGVIMAGGSGTRLWPLSREKVPKQLLRVVKGKSLLRVSYDRLRTFLPDDRIFVCTSVAHRDQVLAELPDMPPKNLLGEPEGRDTANAVGFPAAVLAKIDPDATFAVVTADHVIEPVEVFAECLKVGFKVAADRPGALVTFGIVPTHAHTGLGYVHRGEPLSDYPGTYKVIEFREKPDKPTADKYVESRRYYWNSGMFVWRAATVLEQLKQHLPASHAGLTKIADAYDTSEFEQCVRDVYPTLPKISIDYAVMEPSSRDRTGSVEVVTVEMPVQWLDVGSWPALAETLSLDASNNAIDAAQLIQLDATDNIVVSRDPNHLVALIGVSDLVVVHAGDCTLVCTKGESQRVKEVVQRLKDERKPQFL